MSYGNPDNPHQVLELPHDVWLAPAGKDQFTVQPDEIKHLTVSVRYPGEAAQHADVRRQLGFYVLDAQPSGVTSPIVRGIHARAREAQNVAERRAWANGETGEFVRGLGLGRPLGG
jgi:hypothetical protein